MLLHSSAIISKEGIVAIFRWGYVRSSPANSIPGPDEICQMIPSQPLKIGRSFERPVQPFFGKFIPKLQHQVKLL